MPYPNHMARCRLNPAHKKLDYRATLVFHRVLKFYDNFILLSALTAGLSIGALTFPEFHPSLSPSYKAAEALLLSSTCCALISVMLTVMLSFRFQGHTTATRLELGIAWWPLVLLDWAMFGAIMGVLTWYCAKNIGWRAGVMSMSVGLTLFPTAWIAVWMWQSLSTPGGLGQEEIVATKAAESNQPPAESSVTPRPSRKGSELAPGSLECVYVDYMIIDLIMF